MSAMEFAQWFVYMTHEELLPEVDRLRHAQLLAATHTGAVVNTSKQPWTAEDFTDINVWPSSEEVVASTQTLADQVAFFNGVRK